MKAFKRILSFILMSAIVLSMGLSAKAADDTTITIDGKGKQFFAYRLLDASQSADGSATSYKLNPKYTAILQTVTGASGEKAIIEAIAGYDAAQIRTFADAVFNEITKQGLAADATTTTKKFENIPQGYYLIYENQKADDIENPDGSVTQDQYSLTMIGTAGATEKVIKTKETDVTLIKKVKEKNDTTGAETGWQDAADYDGEVTDGNGNKVGDEVPFKLEGTINENFREFIEYYYEFVDEMSKGLTFNRNTLKVSVNEGGTDITSYFTIDYNVDAAGITHISVKCDNLKVIPENILGRTDKIVVTYTATLNSQAVIGEAGNPNKAKLIYSNRPDNKDKGETPEDKVIVFTYKLKIDKVDGSADPKALEGAGFTLFKKNPQGGWDKVSEEITGVTTFNFNKLDAGDYKIEETTVPSGYNKAEDITFTIVATYDTNSADPKLLTLEVTNVNPQDATFTISKPAGEVATTVVNQSGLELPETGGMGTTLFYIIGALLMIGAGVVLVTRRRVR